MHHHLRPSTKSMKSLVQSTRFTIWRCKWLAALRYKSSSRLWRMLWASRKSWISKLKWWSLSLKTWSLKRSNSKLLLLIGVGKHRHRKCRKQTHHKRSVSREYLLKVQRCLHQTKSTQGRQILLCIMFPIYSSQHHRLRHHQLLRLQTRQPRQPVHHLKIQAVTPGARIRSKWIRVIQHRHWHRGAGSVRIKSARKLIKESEGTNEVLVIINLRIIMSIIMN